MDCKLGLEKRKRFEGVLLGLFLPNYFTDIINKYYIILEVV